MENESKIYRIGHKFFLCLFIFMFLFILADILFISDNSIYYTKKTLIIENRFLIIFAFVFCLLLTFINFFPVLFTRYSDDLCLFIIDASIVLLIIQLFVTYQIYFFPGWDPGGIRRTINNLVYNNQEILINDSSYPYSRFTNNLSLTAILLIITKFCDYFNLFSYSGWLIISILSVNLAAALTFLSTYAITRNTKYSVFSWFIFTLLVALSPWISIPYTDTYVIFLPILTFYLYITLKPFKKNRLRWFLIGFCGFLGYTIKPTAIIVLIAIIILEVWKFFGKFHRKDLLQKIIIIVLLISSILPVYLINGYFKTITQIGIDKNQRFGFLHYAMVGQNPETQGVYSDKDMNFSASFYTNDERDKGNLSIIKQRLADFGLVGYKKFLGKKALVNFSDGTFAWNIEGNFIYQKIEKDNYFATFLRSIYYPDGKFYKIFELSVQLLWFVVLILLLGLGLLWKNPDKKSMTVVLTLLGISLFVMIFEARARYLYSYTPFFMIGACIGLQKLRENRDVIKKFFKINKNKEI